MVKTDDYVKGFKAGYDKGYYKALENEKEKRFLETLGKELRIKVLAEQLKIKLLGDY